MIHDALLTAVHAHPVLVETPTLPLSPRAGTLTLVGEIVYEHAGGGVGGGGVPLAACVTVNVRVAIVSVPVRAAPELGATVKVTDPLPVPVVPDVTTIHGALLVAVH